MRPIRTVLWEGRRCELVAASTCPMLPFAAGAAATGTAAAKVSTTKAATAAETSAAAATATRTGARAAANPERRNTSFVFRAVFGASSFPGPGRDDEDGHNEPED